MNRALGNPLTRTNACESVEAWPTGPSRPVSAGNLEFGQGAEIDWHSYGSTRGVEGQARAVRMLGPLAKNLDVPAVERIEQGLLANPARLGLETA